MTPKISSFNCLICGSLQANDLVLLNDGRGVHRQCIAKAESKLKSYERRIYSVNAAKNKPIALWDRIFSKPKKTEKSIGLQVELSELRKSRTKLQRGYTRVCDYWPSYPPDWSERSALIKERDNHKCKICGSSKVLQVHHQTKLRNGGTNLSANLVTLCKKCHLGVHSVTHFNDGGNSVNEISSFERKHRIINAAIKNGAALKFSYKKYSGERMRRQVKPTRVGKVIPKYRTERTGLYLYGFDFLRKGERCFNISRMTRIEVTSIPNH